MMTSPPDLIDDDAIVGFQMQEAAKAARSPTM
jgi:hypothetical protein